MSKPKFEVPDVSVGQPVTWYSPDGRLTYPAYVSRKNVDGTIYPIIFTSSRIDGSKHGCFHKDDPDREGSPQCQHGYWSLTDRDIEVNRTIDYLKGVIEDFETHIDQLRKDIRSVSNGGGVKPKAKKTAAPPATVEV